MTRDRTKQMLLLGALPLLLALTPRPARADAIVEGAVLPVPLRTDTGKLAERVDCGRRSAQRTPRRVGRILAPRDTGQRA